MSEAMGEAIGTNLVVADVFEAGELRYKSTWPGEEENAEIDLPAAMLLRFRSAEDFQRALAEKKIRLTLFEHDRETDPGPPP